MQLQKKELEPALLTVDLGNFRIGEQETTRDVYHTMILKEGEDIGAASQDFDRVCSIRDNAPSRTRQSLQS